MAKKKKGTKGGALTAPVADVASVPPVGISPHNTDGEKSDWGAKLSQPWTPPEKPAEPPPDDKKRKKGDNTPSVMGFLSRVAGASPSQGKTPARGLLGKITAQDLQDVGRLPEAAPPAEEPKTNGHHQEPVATVSVPERPPLASPPITSPEERLAQLRAMDSQPGSRDQRLSDRFPFSVMVEYSTVGRTSSELAENLSATGMFIHTSTPLEIGDPVMVNFTVPDTSFPLTFPARVKWVSAFGGLDRPTAGMGLEFTALDDKRRRALASIMARLRGGRRG